MKLVSSKTVMERFLSTFPFGWEFNDSDAKEWIVSELFKIKAPQAFKEVITNGEDDNPDYLVVTNYRVALPYDCIELLGVRDYDTKEPYLLSTDKYHPYTAKSFNMEDFVYRERDGYIIIGRQEANLEVKYLALYTDDDGFPMIPDNEDLLTALTYTVADEIATRLWYADKISTEKYKEINKNRLLYRKTASTSFVKIHEQFEVAKNIILRLIPIRHEFETGFYNLGKDR